MSTEESDQKLFWARLGTGFVARYRDHFYDNKQFWTPMDAFVSVESPADFRLRTNLTRLAVYDVLEDPAFPVVQAGYTTDGILQRESSVAHFTKSLKRERGEVTIFCKNRHPSDQAYAHGRDMILNRANVLYREIGRADAAYPPVRFSRLTIG